MEKIGDGDTLENEERPRPQKIHQKSQDRHRPEKFRKILEKSQDCPRPQIFP